MSETPPTGRPERRIFDAKPQIEVDEELAYHLERRIADYESRGMTRDEARKAAMARFGDVASVREICTDILEVDRRATRRRMWFDDLAQDLRFGLRSARRAPLFSALAIVTLALGIGANTAVFGVVKSVLLDALPYEDASQLILVYSVHDDMVLGRTPLSSGVSVDIRERVRSFSQVSAFRQTAGDQTYESTEGAKVVAVATVSADFFTTLGVRSALGRTFTDADALPDASQVAMLDFVTWQRFFGGDSTVVGRPVRLEGAPVVVVGVTPRGFIGPMGPADFYRPLELTSFLNHPVGRRMLRMLGVVGRLAPGATADGAERELRTVAADLAREHPASDASYSLTSVPLRDHMAGESKKPLIVLTASAALVLLIACANLAGALLSRTLSRRKEIAVRRAIGAGRGRIVRQLLTESSVLALAGGVVGVAVACASLAGVRRFAPAVLPAYASLSLDVGALMFSAALALLAALAFGLAPALSATRASAHDSLRMTGVSQTESRGSRRLRGLLVAGQIALSMSLISGAGLLGRSMWALLETPLGFDPTNVFTARVRLPVAKYRQLPVRAEFQRQLEERLRTLPSVTTVSSTSSLPKPVMGRDPFKIEGIEWPADAQPVAIVATVSDDYFRTLRIALRAGRTFGAGDNAGGPPVVVVSESVARRFWPNGQAIGARIRVGDLARAAWSEVIGVVADVRNDPARGESELAVYAALSQRPVFEPTLAIRTECGPADERCDPATLAAAIQREVAAIDPTLTTDRIASLGDLVAAGLTGRRVPVALMAAFAGLALLLASVGVYAMFAAMAVAREREFGLRVALGSSRRGIATLVAREAGRWVGLGLALGAAGVVWIARLVSGLLYGVSRFDGPTLSIAVTVLLVCGTLALIVPIRRATGVDPINVLR